jgi:hypothetical protein
VSTHKAIDLSGIPPAEIALSVLITKDLYGNDVRSACTIPSKTPKMAEEISATFEQERI